MAKPEVKPKTVEEVNLARSIREKRLSLKKGDVGCLRCGWRATNVTAGDAILLDGPRKFEGGTHSCDKSDMARWVKLTRPPEVANDTRDMLAIRRSTDGQGFDLLFVPTIGRSEILAKAEALEFVHQRLIDVMSEKLPYEAMPE